MKTAIIGSGGRECAIAYKISQSKQSDAIYILPGNPGTEQYGINAAVNINDSKEVLDFCIREKIDLVAIGPEAPLINGLADALRANGINVFGPNKNAARIEGEKSFAKELMKKYNIPTAKFGVFDKNDYKKTIEYLTTHSFPVVIKADGLAAGKGVSICENFEEAKKAVEDCFVNNVFGEAGDRIIVEEYMTGEEASIFIITDGDDFVLLPPAQDHKRIFDGDKGKNTGGMGAYAPVPIMTEEILNATIEKIIKPTLLALKNEDSKFNGCLYCGLMLTHDGPKVVEFNCRFGDPETQAVLPLIEGDFLELLYLTAIGKIRKSSLKLSKGCSVCIVAASGGYPDSFEKGYEIKGIDAISNKNILIFPAGVKKVGGKLLTDGGRVIGIVGVIDELDFKKCADLAYNAIELINFKGIHFRKDIAGRVIKNK